MPKPIETIFSEQGYILLKDFYSPETELSPLNQGICNLFEFHLPGFKPFGDFKITDIS